jgi:hypothetical protein
LAAGGRHIFQEEFVSLISILTMRWIPPKLLCTVHVDVVLGFALFMSTLCLALHCSCGNMLGKGVGTWLVLARDRVWELKARVGGERQHLKGARVCDPSHDNDKAQSDEGGLNHGRQTRRERLAHPRRDTNVGRPGRSSHTFGCAGSAYWRRATTLCIVIVMAPHDRRSGRYVCWICQRTK